jgi:hypothetical protein
MRRRFLWAGDQEIHGGKCKVNWTRVCRPIKYEGLGITELKRFSSVKIALFVVQVEEA